MGGNMNISWRKDNFKRHLASGHDDWARMSEKEQTAYINRCEGNYPYDESELDALVTEGRYGQYVS
jgi:hypothetical protein